MANITNKEFLKTSKKEYEYVPGTIFLSRNLYFFAYELPEQLDLQQTFSTTIAKSYFIDMISKKYNGFFLSPNMPVMLLKKELSSNESYCERWQILFNERVGWIGVKNLSEFRHVKTNRRKS